MGKLAIPILKWGVILLILNYFGSSLLGFLSALIVTNIAHTAPDQANQQIWSSPYTWVGLTFIITTLVLSPLFWIFVRKATSEAKNKAGSTWNQSMKWTVSLGTIFIAVVLPIIIKFLLTQHFAYSPAIILPTILGIIAGITSKDSS